MAKKVRHSGKTYPKVNANKIAKALGAKVITDPKERERFEKKYRIPLSLGDRAEDTCGNCKYWDTWGFGEHKNAEVGSCKLVARHWFPKLPDKMISLIGIEHVSYPASELIQVITRREFGCKKFELEDKKPA